MELTSEQIERSHKNLLANVGTEPFAKDPAISMLVAGEFEDGVHSFLFAAIPRTRTAGKSRPPARAFSGLGMLSALILKI